MHFMIASLLLLGFNAKSQRITNVCAGIERRRQVLILLNAASGKLLVAYVAGKIESTIFNNVFRRFVQLNCRKIQQLWHEHTIYDHSSRILCTCIVYNLDYEVPTRSYDNESVESWTGVIMRRAKRREHPLAFCDKIDHATRLIMSIRFSRFLSSPNDDLSDTRVYCDWQWNYFLHVAFIILWIYLTISSS